MPEGEDGASPELREALARIRTLKDVSERKELVAEVVGKIEELFRAQGTPLSPDIGPIYERAHRSPSVLVRQAPLEQVLDLVLAKKPIELDPRQEGRRYANAARFGPGGKGLQTAFSEGRGTENVVVAVIGFDASGLDVQKPEAGADPRDQTLRESVAGTIDPERVKYVVLRVPKPFFPEDELTEEEEEHALYVFRGTSLAA